jgi:hypothetical protein
MTLMSRTLRACLVARFVDLLGRVWMHGSGQVSYQNAGFNRATVNAD